MQLVHACLLHMGHIDDNGDPVPENRRQEYCKWENFDEKIDRVCVIFDRDYRNLEGSIGTIFEICNNHGIKIVMSNPNFELWLLMHFPNIRQYTPQMLLENKKNLRHQLFKELS